MHTYYLSPCFCANFPTTASTVNSHDPAISLIVIVGSTTHLHTLRVQADHPKHCRSLYCFLYVLAVIFINLGRLCHNLLGMDAGKEVENHYAEKYGDASRTCRLAGSVLLEMYPVSSFVCSHMHPRKISRCFHIYNESFILVSPAGCSVLNFFCWEAAEGAINTDTQQRQKGNRDIRVGYGKWQKV